MYTPPKTTTTYIFISLLMLMISTACLTTTMQIQSAPSAAVTPPPTQSSSYSVVATQEQDSGAVFQIVDQETDCATVNAKSLHLRTEPSEQAEHIAYLTAGEQVTILARGDWWYIRTSDGKTGYSNAKYLQECEP